ncbi:MAG: NUDIX domain-containing protein [Nitritalea sp.]
MRIFVNDKPLDLLAVTDVEQREHFDHVYEGVNLRVDQVLLEDDVLILHPSQTCIISLLQRLRTRKLTKLDRITLAWSDKTALKKFVKSRFLTIEAAGGLVRKGEDLLFIHRLGKWDLPKGKFEKGERPVQCAIREVEEECAVRVKAGPLILKTWHTYTQNRKNILKKTYWFEMECLDDQHMAPQKEEGIEAIAWKNHEEAKLALINSYPSMRYLYQMYVKKEQEATR